MQRDFDLVVTILSELRDAETASLSQAEIGAALQASMPDAPDAAVTAHHLDILADAGLIAPVTSQGKGGDPQWRLTWKGHDALDQQEEEEEEEEEEDDDD